MSERPGLVRSGSPRTSSDEPRTAVAAVLPSAVPDRQDRTGLARISIVAAIVVVTLGLLGFAGWVTGPRWLSELLPGTLRVITARMDYLPVSQPDAGMDIPSTEPLQS